MSYFSIKEAFKFSWKTFSERWALLIPVIALLFVLNWIISAIISPGLNWQVAVLGTTGSPVSMLARSLLSLAVSAIFTALAIRVCLQFVDGTAKNFSALFKGITPEMLVRLIGATIVVNIIAAIGYVILGIIFALLVQFGHAGPFLLSFAFTYPAIAVILVTLAVLLPILYVYIRFGFGFFALVDGEPSIGKSLLESSQLTQGVRWQLLWFMVICGGILLLGTIAVLIGLLIALPLVGVAGAHVFRQLEANRNLNPSVKEEDNL